MGGIRQSQLDIYHWWYPSGSVGYILWVVSVSLSWIYTMGGIRQAQLDISHGGICQAQLDIYYGWYPSVSVGYIPLVVSVSLSWIHTTGGIREAQLDINQEWYLYGSVGSPAQKNVQNEYF